MSREHPETAGNAQVLDDALAETFPASDPPSMTSPSAATPSAEVIVEHSTAPLRLYRVVGADEAAQPSHPGDAGGRWSPPGHAGASATASIRPRGGSPSRWARYSSSAPAGESEA